MYLKELCIEGFKSFNQSVKMFFTSQITGIVGPNGSGKSNVTEAFRFVLGEQSLKTMRGRRGEDLIFNGGTAEGPTSHARVSVTFDNRNKVFAYDFDDLTISRTVYRDGTNEYLLNGTQVRHRDIVEVLASANMGASGHHIISQGEADRILNVSSEERKEIVEDGLGLKLLQYKKTEALKKLKKTRMNIDQAEGLLRELSPHLRYLKRQVERYEAAKNLRQELKHLYMEYLVREAQYIIHNEKELQYAYDALKTEIDALEQKITQEKEDSEIEGIITHFTEQMDKNRLVLQEIRNDRGLLERRFGKLEGEIAVLQVQKEQTLENTVSRDSLQNHYTTAEEALKTASTESEYKSILSSLLEAIRALLDAGKSQGGTVSAAEEKKKEEERIDIQRQIEQLKGREKEKLEEQIALQREQEQKIQKAHQYERELLTLVTEKNKKEQECTEISYKLQKINEEKENLQNEVTEGGVLIGTSVIDEYQQQQAPEDTLTEPRSKQQERRKLLERKKIELETMGTDNDEETYKEYQELNERIEFLTQEKEDLLKSMHDCETSIYELQKEIDTRFNKGLQAISVEFDKFFKILFGGGKASVTLEKRKKQTEEDEEPEIRLGVAIHLILPHKKIHSLEQLSGGERALISIALLFAISQITPPPFLILDETDAALDEANSRRYGDMIEELSKRSQLILITHNRETMLRAGALYGVTMNSLGVSTLLSVQFDEAEKVAK